MTVMRTAISLIPGTHTSNRYNHASLSLRFTVATIERVLDPLCTGYYQCRVGVLSSDQIFSLDVG